MNQEKNEADMALHDQLTYGVSITVGGKRIPPEDFYMDSYKNEQSVMMSAFALCPTEQSHPQKMKWIGDYFIKHYVPHVPEYVPLSQEECDRLHYAQGSWTWKFQQVHKAGWDAAMKAQHEAQVPKL